MQAGDWTAAKESFLAGPDGELTPPASRSLKATQTAVGASSKHRVESKSVTMAQQQQIQELQQKLQVGSCRL